MAEYRDEGCQFWTQCGTCPYPDCIADRVNDLLTATRKAEAIELARQGMIKSQIARKLGVSRVTINRYLEGEV